VESKDFRAIISETEPRYRFPNRDTFAENVIPAAYEIVNNRVRQQVSGGCCGITCDAWTSRGGDSYITITAHNIDANFNLNNVVLQTRPMKEAHTGVNTADVLKLAETEWNLTVQSLTTDNASNMKCAASKASMTHIPCFAHTINLAAQKATNIDQFKDLLEKMKPVINYFRRSTSASTVLSEKQKGLGLPEHQLQVDCKTRWNSSYLMVERYIMHHHAINAALDDERLKKKQEVKSLTMLNSDDIGACKEFLTVLQPLYYATLAISTEKKPTGSMIIPLMKKIMDGCKEQDDSQDTPFQKALKKAILSNLELRYMDEELRDFLGCVTALDPRVKHYVGEEHVWGKLASIAAGTERAQLHPAQIYPVTILKNYYYIIIKFIITTLLL